MMLILTLVVVVLLSIISIGTSSSTHGYINTNTRSIRAKVVAITFAVKQRNLDTLEKILYEVSDPKSAKYGKFLTRDEVATLTANTEATDAIKSFLTSKNINSKSTLHGEYVTASATIQQWEDLLHAEFYSFQHESKNEMKAVERANSYVLPSEIVDHVDAVFNLINLPVVQRPVPFKSLRDGASSDVITPAILNSYYNVTSNKGNKFVSQSVFESLDQNYSPSDLKQFQKQYNLPQDTVATVIGGHDDDAACVSDANNCVEANLDVQYLMGLSYFTPTTYYYEDATDSFLAWIQGVANLAVPPC